MGIGIGFGDIDWGLGFGIVDWYWELGIGDWDWGWGLGFGIGDWGLGLGIEMIYPQKTVSHLAVREELLNESNTLDDTLS